jgi:hypothetical protein
MKKLLLLAALSCPVITYAQNNFTTLKEAEEATKDGYKTASGWIVKPGDKIKLGKGTMPDKDFAFIYQSRTMQLLGDASAKKEYLQSNYSNKEATVKKINFVGSKRTGFTPQVVVGVGLLANYWIEIDNAVDAGEIIPPAEYAKKSQSNVGVPSVADELKKLKELLDAGAISKDEYDTQKKKVLSQ